jgi:hypothetical protein
MNPITCYKCGSRKITYYRQIRADGEAVVTARCENDHSPVKGKPFFPKALFNVRALPLLLSQAQMELPSVSLPKVMKFRRLQVPDVASRKIPNRYSGVNLETGKNIPEVIE